MRVNSVRICRLLRRFRVDRLAIPGSRVDGYRYQRRLPRGRGQKAANQREHGRPLPKERRPPAFFGRAVGGEERIFLPALYQPRPIGSLQSEWSNEHCPGDRGFASPRSEPGQTFGPGARARPRACERRAAAASWRVPAEPTVTRLNSQDSRTPLRRPQKCPPKLTRASPCDAAHGRGRHEA